MTFYTRHGRIASLAPLAFLARFICHLLPRNFVRIRHFGLYASGNVNSRLQQARTLLEQKTASTSVPETLVEPEAEPHDEPVSRSRGLIGPLLNFIQGQAANGVELR